jgi:hypothetical protein
MHAYGYQLTSTDTQGPWSLNCLMEGEVQPPNPLKPENDAEPS